MKKIILAYKNKNNLSDYSKEEVEYLDFIHQEIRKWNDSFVDEEPTIEDPNFTDEEILARNHYRAIYLFETTNVGPDKLPDDQIISLD